MARENAKKRLIVGMSGASGAVYGIRLLEMLRPLADIETHLVMSNSAKLNVKLETDWRVEDVEALADEVHDFKDIAASISSGSFKTLGMVVAPCSIKTLSGIAQSYADNLLTRAADVVLKERRRLVLMVRETPLHLGHIRAMAQATEAGAIIMPPVPALYARPQSVEEIVEHSVARALDLFDLDTGKVRRWGEDVGPDATSIEKA